MAIEYNTCAECGRPYTWAVGRLPWCSRLCEYAGTTPDAPAALREFIAWRNSVKRTQLRSHQHRPCPGAHNGD